MSHHDDDIKRDALGLPYKVRPLPPQPKRSILTGMAYRSSANTDLAKTFKRVRREQRELERAREEQAAREAATAPHDVVPINTKRRGTA